MLRECSKEEFEKWGGLCCFVPRGFVKEGVIWVFLRL